MTRSPLSASALFCAGFLISCPCLALPIGQGIGALAWQDEFAGSVLDSTKWTDRYPGVRHDAINTSEAVTLGNGVLSIDTFTRNGIHYTGMIGSEGLFAQAFGYFEARIRFDDSPGSWSAFWLQSSSYGNPIGDPATAGMEIDVVEHRAADQFGNDAGDLLATALHWDGYGTSHRAVGKTAVPPGGLAPGSWHTYGVLWTPESYRFYFDDVLFWTSSIAVSARSEYLILSSEVRDASWAGAIPAGGYGALGDAGSLMQVDYVRAYRLPEPGTVPLLAAGLLAVLGLRRRFGHAACCMLAFSFPRHGPI